MNNLSSSKFCKLNTDINSSQYSLYSDYYWYELGDMISVGDSNNTYYCFPPGDIDVAAKTRIAVEEIKKLKKIK